VHIEDVRIVAIHKERRHAETELQDARRDKRVSQLLRCRRRAIWRARRETWGTFPAVTCWGHPVDRSIEDLVGRRPPGLYIDMLEPIRGFHPVLLLLPLLPKGHGAGRGSTRLFADQAIPVGLQAEYSMDAGRMKVDATKVRTWIEGR
jgi:hypothetical protein